MWSSRSVEALLQFCAQGGKRRHIEWTSSTLHHNQLPLPQHIQLQARVPMAIPYPIAQGYPGFSWIVLFPHLDTLFSPSPQEHNLQDPKFLHQLSLSIPNLQGTNQPTNTTLALPHPFIILSSKLTQSSSPLTLSTSQNLEMALKETN